MGIKIVLVDDHQVLREGLCMLLDQQPAMEVVGTAHDGESAVQLVLETMPDVVLMDIGLPGMGGIEATRQVKEKAPSVKVVALSMHCNKLFIEDMFGAGASGYLLKESASDELVTAINTVLAGELYLSPKITGFVLESAQQTSFVEENSIALLNEKECEVLRFLAEGKSTKEIAKIVGKSGQSIDALRRGIMKKLELENLAELVKFAIREGLTSLEPRP